MRPRVRRRLLAAWAGRVVCATCLAGLATFALAGCAERSASRSLLLFTLDTTRWDRLGIYGDATARTPHLDALGRSGIVFENAFVDVPSTLPSHTTMMTGAVSLRHGVRLNGEFELPEAASPLAERLGAAGWSTGGVIASATLKAVHGIAQGFGAWDETFRNPYRGFDPALANRNRRHEGVQRRADEVSTVALEMLDAFAADAPWFLWVHYVDPHREFDPPPPWGRALDGDRYAGEIAFTDRELGRVLRAAAARENNPAPVVAVLSDHGEGLGEHGQDGHGMFLYESTTRIPFLLGVPGEAPRIDRALARNADLAPTLEAAAGAPSSRWPDGANLLEKGAAAERVLHESLTPTRRYGGTPIKAVRTGDAKYVHAPRPELYDLDRDPNELENLFALDSPAATALRDWLEDEVDRLTVRGDDAESRTTLDDDQIEAIRSLGYVVDAGEKLPPDEMTLDGIDPKDLIDVVLAHRYVFDGRHAEARPRVDRFFERYPERPSPAWNRLYARALVARALVEASEGRGDGVRASLAEALRLDPEYGEARAMLERDRR